MQNQIFSKILFFSLVFLLAVETANADILTQLGDLAKFGQCGMKVNNNDKFTQCKEKVTDNWKAETKPKRQACCKAMAFLNCTVETAKEICNEAEARSVETSQKTSFRLGDKSCILYYENPSMCGTCALIPVLSLIVISFVAVFRIS